jgi:hypothetical protein
MYDAESLTRLLAGMGFTDAIVLPPGKTTIEDPKGLNLTERSDDSVYVEAIKPG